MSTPASAWTYDSARGEYYYFSTAEQAYIYQNGQKIYVNQSNSSVAQEPGVQSGRFVGLSLYLASLTLTVHAVMTPAAELRHLNWFVI
jgi:hypothetical protein